MLPLERIIRGWKLCSSNGKRLQTRLKNGRPETVVKRGKSKCLSGSSGQGYIHFAWPHDRALRTFKASARLYSNQASREAKARALHEECLKMGAPHIEDIILGFVNNFKSYSSPDPLYD